MGEGIDASDVVIGGTAFIEDNGAVELGSLFADALFAGDSAAFFGGDDLFADGVGLIGERGELLGEGVTFRESGGAGRQIGAHSVDAVDIEGEVAEEFETRMAAANS